MPLWGQSDSTRVRGIQFNSRNEDSAAAQKKATGLTGFSVSVDVVGVIQRMVSSYGQAEAAVRLNIGHRWFPTVEVGWGDADRKGEDTHLHYKTSAPFFRVGCDYNFLRDWQSGNRLFGGIRLAYSDFKYSLTGPALIDPYWKTSTAWDFNNIRANMLWAEFVFGLEAKIWHNFHLGWTARYRRRISQHSDLSGEAWYVPGYGKNDGHVITGTFNLVLDI